jgi:hypothetical protein
VEAALAEPRCFPLKKNNRTASPHPKTALVTGVLSGNRLPTCPQLAWSAIGSSYAAHRKVSGLLAVVDLDPFISTG